MLNGASFFFNCSLYTYFQEAYIILLISIQGIGYGIIGVVILLIMILTAFLRLCFSMGSNELLGSYSNLLIYVLLSLL